MKLKKLAAIAGAAIGLSAAVPASAQNIGSESPIQDCLTNALNEAPQYGEHLSKMDDISCSIDPKGQTVISSISKGQAVITGRDGVTKMFIDSVRPKEQRVALNALSPQQQALASAASYATRSILGRRQ